VISRKSRHIEDEPFSTFQLSLSWSRDFLAYAGFRLSSIYRCAAACVGHVRKKIV